MDKELFGFQKNAILGNIAQPLCSEYKAAWRACGDDKEMLVRLALQQQSIPYMSHACYEHLGLTKEYIMKNFSEYINGKRTFSDVDGVNGYTYQIYVGHEEDIDVSCDVISLMWCSGITLTIPVTKCPVIYISNKSDVNIVCDGYNTPRIYLFDESRLVVEDTDDTCGMSVFRYSDDTVVDKGKYCIGKVRIFSKKLKL